MTIARGMNVWHGQPVRAAAPGQTTPGSHPSGPIGPGGSRPGGTHSRCGMVATAASAGPRGHAGVGRGEDRRGAERHSPSRCGAALGPCEPVRQAAALTAGRLARRVPQPGGTRPAQRSPGWASTSRSYALNIEARDAGEADCEPPPRHEYRMVGPFETPSSPAYRCLGPAQQVPARYGAAIVTLHHFTYSALPALSSE